MPARKLLKRFALEGTAEVVTMDLGLDNTYHPTILP